MRNIVTVALAGLVLGCSPGMFSTSGVDQGVKNAPSYRHTPTICTGLRLERSALDAPSFRHLVACLNAHHGLQPLEDLVDQVTDEEISLFLDFANLELFNNFKRLHQIEDTFSVLDKAGSLDPIFENIGKILANTDFVVNAVHLFREVYRRDSNSVSDLIEKIGNNFEPKKVQTNLELLFAISSAPAFQSLSETFARAEPIDSVRFAISVQSYLKEASFPIGKEFVKAFQSGSVFSVLDSYMGVKKSELKLGIPKFAAVLESTLGEGRLDGLLDTFYNLRQPVFCLNSSQVIRDPIMLMMDELNRVKSADAPLFVQKDSLLFHGAVGPFCQFPSYIGQSYASLVQLSELSSFPDVIDFLQQLYRGGKKHELFKLLTHSFGDPAVKKLAPYLLELNKKAALLDLSALIALPVLNDRSELQKSLGVWVEPVSSSNHVIPLEILSNTVSVADSSRLAKLFSGVQKYLSSDLTLQDLTQLLLVGYHSNEVHPLLDIVKSFTSGFKSRTRILEAFFGISEKPEFGKTLQLLSKMSMDGRLKEVVRETLELFHVFSLQDGSRIDHEKFELPDVKHRLRHTWSSKNLSKKVVKNIPGPSECKAFNLGSSILGSKNLNHFLGCLNENGKFDDVVQSVHFLENQKSEVGTTYLNLTFDLVRSLNLNRVQSGYLMSSWMRIYDQGEFNRMLDLIPVWVSGGESSIAYSLLKLSKPIIEGARGALQRTQKYLASVLRREDFAANVGFLQKLFNSEGKRRESVVEHFDRDQIRLWLKENECADPETQRNLDRRMEAMIDDYSNSVTSWDLKNGVARRAWELSEFKSLIEPVFNKIGDAHQSIASKTLINGIVEFNQNYTLPRNAKPKQGKLQTIDDLYYWFKLRSSDAQVINYIYPGETKVRSRMINTLERFEVVLINSDVVVPVTGTNYGTRFMAKIGEAWGDESEQVWPDEIYEKYKTTGKRPQTLAEAVDDIEQTQKFLESMLGYPDFPKCMGIRNPGMAPDILPDLKVSLYNIRQVLSVLRENLPHSGTVYDGGLKFFRNLFFQVYYSTPSQFRTDDSGEKNNLVIIGKIARSGLLHQLARGFRQTDNEDTVAYDALKAFVMASSLPEMKIVLTQLFSQDPKRELLWNLISEIFSALDHQGSRKSLKQFGLYSLAVVDGLDSSSTKILPGFVKTLGSVLVGHYEFLKKNISLIDFVMKTESVAEFFQVLYENDDPAAKQALGTWVGEFLGDGSHSLDLLSMLAEIDQNPESRRYAKKFIQRWEKLNDNSIYRSLTSKNVLFQMMSFFSEEGGRESIETARVLREFLAKGLMDQTFEAYVWLAAYKPKELYQVLETVSRSIESGELKKFFDRIRRSLSDGKR